MFGFPNALVFSDVFRKGLSCGDTGDSGQDFDIYEGKEGNSTQKPV